MCSNLLLYILLQINGGSIDPQERMTISQVNGTYTMDIYSRSTDTTPSYSKGLGSLELTQLFLNETDRQNKIVIGNDNITVGNSICNENLYSEASHKLDKCLIGLKLGLVKKMEVDNAASSFKCEL